MDKDIQQRINTFKGLSFNDKKEKLLSFIGGIHDKEGYFFDLQKRIIDDKYITDYQMIKIYQYIIEYIEELKNVNNNESQIFMNKLKEKMKNLHDDEEKIRKQENPDKMMDDYLNNI